MTGNDLLQFFQYEHLKPELQEVSRPFCMLAARLYATVPQNLQRDLMLIKLLEAKDCAVRAALYREPEQEQT